jgi:hypothetical protein
MINCVKPQKVVRIAGSASACEKVRLPAIIDPIIPYDDAAFLSRGKTRIHEKKEIRSQS